MTEWCDRDPTSIAPGEGPSKVQQDLGRAFFVIRSRGSRQKNSDNPKAFHRSSKARRAESRLQHFTVPPDSRVRQLISFAVDRALARDMPASVLIFMRSYIATFLPLPLTVVACLTFMQGFPVRSVG